MTITAVSADANALVHPIIAARGFTQKLIDAVPDDKALHQPFEGCNHIHWTIGHIATSDDYFMKALFDKEPKLEAWFEMFGPGSKPDPEGKGYPSIQELKDAMEDRHAALLDTFRGLSDEQWHAELPDDWKPFAPTYLELPGVIAWHEGMHAGQIALVRKSFGGEPVMM